MKCLLSISKLQASSFCTQLSFPLIPQGLPKTISQQILFRSVNFRGLSVDNLDSGVLSLVPSCVLRQCPQRGGNHCFRTVSRSANKTSDPESATGTCRQLGHETLHLQQGNTCLLVTNWSLDEDVCQLYLHILFENHQTCRNSILLVKFALASSSKQCWYFPLHLFPLLFFSLYFSDHWAAKVIFFTSSH